MGSVYKALMRAAQEREAQRRKADAPTAPEPQPQVDSQGMEEDMLALLESIESVLSTRKQKIIQFIGSQGGEQSSNLARAYARAFASMSGLPVLLIDSPPQRQDFVPSLSRVLEARSGDTKPLSLPESAFLQAGESGLFLCPSAGSALCSAEGLSQPTTQRLWEQLRNRFALIVIDSGPLTSSCDAPLDIAGVDGVVLVFESELPGAGICCTHDDIGLESILDLVAKGGLSPTEVVTCFGAPLLLLTPGPPGSGA